MFRRFFGRATVKTPSYNMPRSVRAQKLMEIRDKLSRHKYKIIFFSAALTYISFPNQVKKLTNYYKDKLNLKTRDVLKENQPPSDIFKTFLKESLAGTFKDDQIKKEGVVYLEKLLKEKPVIDQVLNILLKSIKDETFVEESKVLGKKIVLALTNDKEVENSLVQMFARIFKRDEIKNEAAELVKFVFNQPDTKDELVDLMVKAFGTEKINDALQNALASAFYDILMDKETNHRMKIFIYNFLESGKDQNNKDSILDLIIQKLMSKTDTDEHKGDLDKFFNNLNKRFNEDGKTDLEDILKK